MSNELNVAIIGLDTSHAVEFPRHFQAPDCPPDLRIEGLRFERCLRFETPFQNKDGLDGRQRQLEKWGIRVTESFDEAVQGCDAIMIEINDPALHLEYFRKCATLGKPIFLDKPLSDSFQNGELVFEEARKRGIRFFSASSLRFVHELEDACRDVPRPTAGAVYGPLGKAPSGSSIVWYGVHAFEMLQRAMGTGARGVFARYDASGVVATVSYGDGRRGVVELTEGSSNYGGTLRTKDGTRPFVVDMERAYAELLLRITDFFHGGAQPVTIVATREIMAMLDAAEHSVRSGREEPTGL
jgi:predicted dehydrogenase